MGMFRFLSCMTVKLKVAVIYMSCWKPKPQLEVAAMSDSSGSWTGDCTEADGSFTEVTYDCPLDLIYSFGPIVDWMVRVVSCFDVMLFFWELAESPRWSPNICESGTGLTNLQILFIFIGLGGLGNLNESHRPIVATSTPWWQEWIPPRPRPWPPFKSLWRICWSWPQALREVQAETPTKLLCLPGLEVFCFVSLEGYCKPCHESVRDEVWLLVVRDVCGSLWLSELEDQYFLDKIALIGTGVTCGFMGETYKEHNRRSLFEKRWPAMPALTGRGERDVLWWCLGH